MQKLKSPLPRIVIATRESALALWQANHVKGLLRRLYPELEVVISGMTTKGDQTLDRPLAKVGGKGLFIKELEFAMLEGRADIAVHSMKDLPADLDERFVLAAIGEREEPTDAFVSNRYANPARLPAGALVGTSSLRRECQLRRRFPDINVRFLRGNLQTRLRKLDQGEFDAIILAYSGLRRLGMEERVASAMPVEESLPAPGQGALGIECVAGRDDLVELLAPLRHRETSLCVAAERALSKALNGGCHAPVGAYAVMEGGQVWLRSFIARADGSDYLFAEGRAEAEGGEALGRSVADELLAQGAGRILAELA